MGEERGRFIVFEGLDGAGTSTQMALLGRLLQECGIAVKLTQEPSNGPIGGAIRGILNGTSVVDDPVALALAFAADRADHLSNKEDGILGSLEQGVWVLCDRYVLSSLAYQTSSSTDLEWLITVNRFAIEPDATVFIDTPVKECLERIHQRNPRFELFHNRVELERVLKNYRRVTRRREFIGHLITVDGNRTETEVFSELVGEFRKWLRSIGSEIVIAAPTAERNE